MRWRAEEKSTDGMCGAPRTKSADRKALRRLSIPEDKVKGFRTAIAYDDSALINIRRAAQRGRTERTYNDTP